MLSRIAVLAGLILVGSGVPAAAVTVGTVIAETGFNDAIGVNGNPTPDSPYDLGETIRSRGGGEPGWANTWTLSAGGGAGGAPSRAVASTSDPFEGDASLFIKKNDRYMPTWIHRALSQAQSSPFFIEQYVRMPEGGGVTSRPGRGGTGSKIGPQWSANTGGSFLAFDGNGNGDGGYESTGLTWEPMQWYKVSLLVDPTTQTYDFFVDDQKYDAPDPLGFRGNPQSIFFIEYLTSEAIWIDQIRIAEVPEPGTFVLSGMGVVGLLCVARRRKG